MADTVAAVAQSMTQLASATAAAVGAMQKYQSQVMRQEEAKPYRLKDESIWEREYQRRDREQRRRQRDIDEDNRVLGFSYRLQKPPRQSRQERAEEERKQLLEEERKKEEAYQSKLQGRLDAYRESQRLQQDMARILEEEKSKEEKILEVIKQQTKARKEAASALEKERDKRARANALEYNTRAAPVPRALGALGRGAAGILPGAAGMFGLGALANVANPMGMLSLALAGSELMGRGVQRGEGLFNSSSFYREYRRSLEGLPGIGWAFRAGNQILPAFQQERNLTEREVDTQRLRREMMIRAAGETEQRRLIESNAGLGAALRFGPSATGQRFAERRFATLFQDVALANAGGRYARGAEEEDIRRRTELEASLAERGAEQRYQQQILGHKRSLANRQVTGLTERLAGEEAQAATQQKQYEARVSAFRDLLAQPGATPEGSEQMALKVEEERLKLQQALTQVAETRKQLQEAATHSTALEVENAERLKQYHEGNLAMLQQEYRQQSLIAQAERSRLRGMQENIGLMLPHEQQTIRRIAQRLQAGQAPTFGELRYMQQHRDIFQQPLERIGRERGAPFMDELRRMSVLGLESREKAAESRKLQLEAQIKQEWNLNIGDSANAIAQQIAPRLKGLFNEIGDRILQQVRSDLLEAAGVRRAANGGA